MFGFAVAAALALATPIPQSPFDRVVPLVRQGDPVPQTQFADQDGSRIGFAQLRGNAVAVAFVYTRCRDECPIITAKFARLHALLGAGPYRLVEVTIDPAHDSPQVLRAYARGYGARAPQWMFFTGPPADVVDFDHKMGVQSVGAGGVEIIHNDRLAFVAPDGTIADLVDGSSWTAADAASELKHLAGAAASPLARFDLAVGAAVAYCGGVLTGRAGIGDLLASVAVLMGGAAFFIWFVRRIGAQRGDAAAGR